MFGKIYCEIRIRVFTNTTGRWDKWHGCDLPKRWTKAQKQKQLFDSAIYDIRVNGFTHEGVHIPYREVRKVVIEEYRETNF